MTVLIFGDQLEHDTQRVRRYAEQPANWYAPGVGLLPGDTEAYTLHSGTIKAVFTWTYSGPSKISRHLSVSTGGRGKYPSTVVVATLAHMLGFTGATADDHGVVYQLPDDGWDMGINDAEETVVIVQDVTSPLRRS